MKKSTIAWAFLFISIYSMGYIGASNELSTAMLYSLPFIFTAALSEFFYHRFLSKELKTEESV